MGRQIIKQPNGRFSIFSSISDNMIVDLSPQQVVQVFIDLESERIKSDVKETIEQIEKGEKPYFSFTKTWDSALATVKRVHGKERVDELLAELARNQKRRDSRRSNQRRPRKHCGRA